MPNRIMYEIRVAVAGEPNDAGDILIIQGDPGGNTPFMVVAHYAQIDLLCQWLQEAKVDAESRAASREQGGIDG